MRWLPKRPTKRRRANATRTVFVCRRRARAVAPAWTWGFPAKSRKTHGPRIPRTSALPRLVSRPGCCRSAASLTRGTSPAEEHKCVALPKRERAPSSASPVSAVCAPTLGNCSCSGATRGASAHSVTLRGRGSIARGHALRPVPSVCTQNVSAGVGLSTCSTCALLTLV